MKNKIMIISNNTSGFLNHREELLDGLLEFNSQIVFVSPFDSQTKYLEDKGIICIDSNISRRSQNIYKDIRLFKEYCKFIKKHKPDLILTFSVKPNIYGGMAAKKFKIPYISSITGLGSAFYNNNWLKRLIITLYRRSFSRSSHVFFQNSSNLDLFIKNKIVHTNFSLVSGSGVNLDKFKMLKYPNNRKRIELSYIGRIMREKGIEELIQAIINLNSKEIIFNFIGPFEEDHFKLKIKDLESKGLAKYYGTVSDIVPFIQKSDAIINPSYHEGMSNVLLEAAASARPMIASDIPGCNDIVENGISGFLFNVKDINSLTDSILKFTSLSYDVREKMGLNGRKKIESNFNRKIVTEQYLLIIKNILNKENKNEFI